MRINGYEYKEELRYSKKHVWVRIIGEKVILGLDAFIIHQMENITDIELTYIDNELEKDDSMATIYYQGEILDIFPPFAGKVSNVNEKLEDEPELLLEDPYGKGWLIEMEGVLQEELDRLLFEEIAEDWFHQEANKD